MKKGFNSKPLLLSLVVITAFLCIATSGYFVEAVTYSTSWHNDRDYWGYWSSQAETWLEYWENFNYRHSGPDEDTVQYEIETREVNVHYCIAHGSYIGWEVSDGTVSRPELDDWMEGRSKVKVGILINCGAFGSYADNTMHGKLRKGSITDTITYGLIDFGGPGAPTMWYEYDWEAFIFSEPAIMQMTIYEAWYEATYDEYTDMIDYTGIRGDDDVEWGPGGQ